MFINEQNGTQMWTKMLKENFNVQDTEKLNWVSQYAAIHEIHESMLGVGGANIGGQVAPAQGVSPLYATPLNTLGIGNPMAPGYAANGQVPMGGTGDFMKQAVGSGDIPVSTLPMALNVALLTIGLELIPVIPAKGPWAMLTYMDFPYAGGKMGRKNEVAGLDGVGEGAENKPLYVKFVGFEKVGELRKLEEGAGITVTSAAGTFEGTFKCLGRMDGGVIVAVKSCKDANDKNIAIADIFSSAATLSAQPLALGAAAISGTVESVDFAQTMVDFVDGFANFATGEKRSMTRAENETGTGNVIGLRLFSKWVQMGSYEVTGTVTRQQLQDLPLYGVDAVAKVMEAMQNEITQSINARILEHVFALGVTNAVNQKNYHGVDLNLWMGTTDTTMADQSIKVFKDIYGNDWKANWGTIKNSEVNTSAENLHTRQRRIGSKLLAAANLIQVTGRRGRPTWAVTNAQVATALQDVSGYVVAPIVNNFAQDGSQNLYMSGTIAGLKIYVDPYMDWDDTRICVGRKGNGNEPGVIFMPYILADTISITAEGTMAPKMLVNSRYAIAEAGFFPELAYFTMVVDSEFDII
jgi:hypothetical protein